MEALDDEIGKRFGLFLLDKAVAVKIITRQKRVVDERKLRHRPVTKTLLGHVAQALGATLGRIEIVDHFAEKLHGTLRLLEFTHANAEQSRLTVTGNAGDADDFTRTHRELDVRKPRDVMAAVETHALEFERHFAGRAFRSQKLGRFLADHQAREFLFGFFLRIDRFDHAAGAKNRAAIG